MSTAEDPGAPGQRELNEAQRHPHFLVLFFASALLHVPAVNFAIFGCRPSAARQRWVHPPI